MKEITQERGQITDKPNSPEVSYKMDNKMIEQSNSNNIFEELYNPLLLKESYEDVESAACDMNGLKNFRQRFTRSHFGSFHTIIETVTLINKLPISKIEKNERKINFLESVEAKAYVMSPHIADLYLGIIAELKGENYNSKHDIIRAKLEDLKKSEQKVSDFEVLFSGSVPWDIKETYTDATLEKILSGFRYRDKVIGNEMSDDVRMWREEQINNTPSTPPPSSNRSKPGVDPMERLKNNEHPPHFWSITPAWNAHYRQKSLSKWDNERNEWYEDKIYDTPVLTIPLSGRVSKGSIPGDITMTGMAEIGVWYDIPISYTHGLHTISSEHREIQVEATQSGDIRYRIMGTGGEVVVTAVFAPIVGKKFIEDNPDGVEVPEFHAGFSELTNTTLKEIDKKYQGNIAKAQAIKAYIMRTVIYLSPKDILEAGSFNIFCRNHEHGFAGAVDEAHKGDCDVVNTYFAALCAQLGIPVRHVVGHSVSGAQNGIGGIHSGTGHAWSEAYDDIVQIWVRIDATPPGDPNADKEENNKKGEKVAGEDFADEAQELSYEKIEQLLKQLKEHKLQLSYTKEEHSLAEGAEIDLPTAREIVKEITQAENIKLANGERIVDVLAKLFNMIIQSRKSSTMGYVGPVKASEGGEAIEDIVSHYIQAVSGNMDPRSRSVPIKEKKIEKLMGGFDIYMIGDKSGSMSSTSEGEALWKIQRRSMYLILSALHSFERNLEKAGLREDNKLSVRTQSISFRGDEDSEIDVDKELSSQFTSVDKVRMWNSLTDASGGNGDPAALSYVSKQIHDEYDKNTLSGGKNDRLRIVIACSDGGYIGDDAQKMRSLSEELSQTGTIVVGMGITKSANSVPIVMNNPPYSYGDLVENMQDLPIKVTKHIVLQAIKLFPEKASEDAQEILKRTIALFEKNTV